MNHDFPPSFSEYGKLRHPSSTSDILDCLKSASVTQLERYDPLQLMLVLSMDLHGYISTKSSKTFGMYCDEVLSPIVRSGIKRSDFIFDIYRSDSLKKGDRIRRGCNDNRFSVRKETSIPRNFIAFLGNDSNKTELFYLIDVISEGENQHMTIVGTKGLEVVSNKEIKP